MNQKNVPWQPLLKEVLAETNKEKLASKAEELETAIFFRMQELESSADASDEGERLKAAIEVLFRTKVEKLGYPVSTLRSFLGGKIEQ